MASPSEPALRRDDVVLVRFPFTDLTATKLRPAVVLAVSGSEDVVLAFVTSRVNRRLRFGVPVAENDPEFAAAGLRISSAIRVDRLVTLHRQLLLRRLGRLGPGLRSSVGAALQELFELDGISHGSG
jgi:mRNA interferase MazF